MGTNNTSTVKSESAKRREKIAAARKKQKWAVIRNTAITVIVILLAVFIPVSINSATQNGYFLRKKIAMQTGDRQITGTMLRYYFYRGYQEFATEYSDYLTTVFGLDTSKSLKTQKYSDTQTWYDYFRDEAANEAKDVLLFCKYADDNGIVLSEDDLTEIDDYFKQVYDYAEENDMKVDEYFSNVYGTGVTEVDARACVEMSTLANRGYTELMDKFEYDDSQMDDYYAENEKDFLQFDYKSYEFEYEAPQTSSATSSASSAATSSEQAQPSEEQLAAKAFAESLATASDPEQFDSQLRDYLLANVYVTDTDSPKTDAEKEESVKTDLGKTAVKGTKYTADDELSEWAFAEDRKVGDTKVIEHTDGYVTYMVTKTAYRDETVTKNARHILLTAETYGKTEDTDTDTDTETDEEAAKAAANEATLKAAKELLAQWESGEATEASFAALATEKSEDTGSTESGGLYENIYIGQMKTEFENWVFDAARTPGETGIISTDYDYHIMYFVGDGVETWKLTAISGLKTEYYEAEYETLEQTYPITNDDTTIGKAGG